MNIVCQNCSQAFEASGSRGRTPKYCGAACRKAAQRARRMTPAIPFPEEMIEPRRWVRADGKRPIHPDGSPASSTNPRTWSAFSDVQQGEGDGFGVMLGDGMAVIDLDRCIDAKGRLSRLAQLLVDRNPGAFIERSVSGRGLHIFGRLPARRGRKLPGMEIYSVARFVRTTGDVYQVGGLETLKY